MVPGFLPKPPATGQTRAAGGGNYSRSDGIANIGASDGRGIHLRIPIPAAHDRCQIAALEYSTASSSPFKWAYFDRSPNRPENAAGQSANPHWTVGRTIFEMRLGHL